MKRERFDALTKQKNTIQLAFYIYVQTCISSATGIMIIEENLFLINESSFCTSFYNSWPTKEMSYVIFTKQNLRTHTHTSRTLKISEREYRSKLIIVNGFVIVIIQSCWVNRQGCDLDIVEYVNDTTWYINFFLSIEISCQSALFYCD